MSDHHGRNGAGTLSPPVRNRFFYGKLMDVRHFEMEQHYFLKKRRLLNRLGLGSGVLCGLEVEATNDGKIIVHPGVAIDYRGREIVVTAPYCLEHPLQPTDACGEPHGDPIQRGTITLFICYHECDTEPAPVLVSDCDTQLDCRASAVQERFRLLVHEGKPDHGPPHLDPKQCRAIFPAKPPAKFDHRLAVCEVLSGDCPPFLDDCVVLATISTEDGRKLVVDECTYRTVVYSNEMLLELLLCLAERVDECCNGKPPVTTLPVINAIWPKNKGELRLVSGNANPEWNQWKKEARLEVTFDRVMKAAEVQAPDDWLRLFAVYSLGQNEIRVVRMKLAYNRLEPNPQIPGPGSTAVYRVDKKQITKVDQEASRPTHGTKAEIKFLVQIRSGGGSQIHDASPPGDLLDADFAGTGLNSAQLDDVWTVPIGTPKTYGQALWDDLVLDGGQLPSGNGTAGGRFHSFFTYLRSQ
jgi:hypothetical protein